MSEQVTLELQCPVRKHVERCAIDANFMVTTYEYVHTHLPPKVSNSNNSNNSNNNTASSSIMNGNNMFGNDVSVTNTKLISKTSASSSSLSHLNGQANPNLKDISKAKLTSNANKPMVTSCDGNKKPVHDSNATKSNGNNNTLKSNSNRSRPSSSKSKTSANSSKKTLDSNPNTMNDISNFIDASGPGLFSGNCSSITLLGEDIATHNHHDNLVQITSVFNTPDNSNDSKSNSTNSNIRMNKLNFTGNSLYGSPSIFCDFDELDEDLLFGSFASHEEDIYNTDSFITSTLNTDDTEGVTMDALGADHSNKNNTSSIFK